MSEEKIEKTVGAEDQGGWKIILPDKREVIIDRELVVLGRQEGSVDILIDDKMLSRRHCKFILQGQKLILEDLGSRNGTFVNNQKVTRIELSSGDVIRVGGTELKVEFFRARSGYETISALLSGETLEIGSDIREQIREREKKEEIREREKKEEKPRYGEKRKKIGVFVVWGGSVIVSSAFIITAVLSYNKSLYQEALQVMRQTYNIANFYYQRFDFEAAQTYANILLKLVDRFSKYGDFSKVQKTVSELIEKLDKERENRNKLIYALKKMNSGDLEGAFSDLGSIPSDSVFAQSSAKMNERVKAGIVNIFTAYLEQMKKNISEIRIEGCDLNCDFSNFENQISNMENMKKFLKENELVNIFENLKKTLYDTKSECEKRLESCMKARQSGDLLARAKILIREGNISEAEKLLGMVDSQESKKILNAISTLKDLSNKFMKAFDKYDITSMRNIFDNMKKVELSISGATSFTKSFMKRLAREILSECSSQFEMKRYKESYILCSFIDSSEAKSIISAIEERAQKMLKDCESAAQLNAKVAMQKCEEVKKIVPEFSDLYKRAQNIMDKLK